MKITTVFAAVMVLAAAGCAGAAREGRPAGLNFGEREYYRLAGPDADPVDLANPLMGTDSIMSYSHGNTYPAVAAPWGMHFWTPQTGPNGYGWIYSYRDTQIRGFRLTHQPSPWINDYGSISLMPVTGAPFTGQFARASSFRHAAEVSTPYYYKVSLDRYGVDGEVAAASRAAALRFTYPPRAAAFVTLDVMTAKSEIEIDEAKRQVTGYTTHNTGGVPDNFKMWFVIEFDGEIKNAAPWPWMKGKACVRVAPPGDGPLTVKVGASFISLEQAELNLSREIGAKSFDEVREEAREAWSREFSRIEVEGGEPADRATFYSTLYRVLLFPRKFYEIDADGRVAHYSPFNGEVLPGYMFTDNGFWDTFRAVFPFFALMYPEMDGRIMEGLVNAYREGGRLPEWASPGYTDCMIGAHAASLLADAYVKGVRGFDAEAAWQAMKKDAEVPEPRMHSLGRYGLEYYNRLGYIPCDVGINENVARSLEYAYDDFCMAAFAREAGVPRADYQVYLDRAMNYRKLFDAETGFMRGRREDGAFREDFNPYSWGGDFTEGSAWHYTWSVFHDPAGLIELFGGRDAFVAKLDSVFTTPPEAEYSYYGFKIHEIAEMEAGGMGQYAHGNQPIQHAIYMYDWAGEPWKAQARAREVMAKLYNPHPNGYCGDEDNGQTSAWFVFSALGFYPVCPGSTHYAIGSPLFERATLRMPGGNALIIEAPGNSATNVYIRRAWLNGVEIERNYLTHKELQAGGTLRFEMSGEPNRERGAREEDAPYSLSLDEWYLQRKN